MPSSKGYLDFILDQLSELGIEHRAMKCCSSTGSMTASFSAGS